MEIPPNMATMAGARVMPSAGPLKKRYQAVLLRARISEKIIQTVLKSVLEGNGSPLQIAPLVIVSSMPPLCPDGCRFRHRCNGGRHGLLP